MPRLMGPRATWAVLRAGDPRARLRAFRDGQAALRLHVTGAALRCGLLEALRDGPLTAAELARRTGAPAEQPLHAWLRVVESVGLVRQDGGAWGMTARSRALLEDDWQRATYEAFAGFHTDLYRQLDTQLRGGRRRRDVAEQGELIARLSNGFEPFVLGELTRRVTEQGPARVLDVGCGGGVNLAAMLAAAPGARGVGIDADADAVALAAATLERHGVADRAQVVRADVRDTVRGRPEPFGAPFDLALLANVVYYLPPAERVALLRDVAGLLAPGGVLLVITMVVDASLASRHFDLLLRAQEGDMQLPDPDTLAFQMTEAGLAAVRVDRLMPGAPPVIAGGTVPS